MMSCDALSRLLPSENRLRRCVHHRVLAASSPCPRHVGAGAPLLVTCEYDPRHSWPGSDLLAYQTVPPARWANERHAHVTLVSLRRTRTHTADSGGDESFEPVCSLREGSGRRGVDASHGAQKIHDALLRADARDVWLPNASTSPPSSPPRPSPHTCLLYTSAVTVVQSVVPSICTHPRPARRALGAVLVRKRYPFPDRAKPRGSGSLTSASGIPGSCATPLAALPITLPPFPSAASSRPPPLRRILSPPTVFTRGSRPCRQPLSLRPRSPAAPHLPHWTSLESAGASGPLGQAQPRLCY